MPDFKNTQAVSPNWLRLGQEHLATGDLANAAAALKKALTDPETRLAAHNLIERNHLEGAFSEWMGLNCEIHPADDIYRFFAGHPSSTNPLRDYLADGWRTLSELMWLLEGVGKPLRQTGSFLEFASGHGRFTRHLARAMGADRVTVSDIVAGANDFAGSAFGVRTLNSAADPDQLVWPERYDVVFVLSLFSHLPRSSWCRWLDCLYRAVAPGGVLIFTTHGEEAARRQRVAVPDDGFYFSPASESSAIDVDTYGTTFTMPHFVHAEISRSIGLPQLVQEVPAYFWGHQDAYVLARGES